MNKNKILHVMIMANFMPPYIDFVDEYFGRENHQYVFITSEKYEYGLTPEHKVEFLHTDDDIFITLLEYMRVAKKIILHGLWRDKVDVLLYFNQKILKKCYWIMWGGDFYFPETKSSIKHEVIKNMGFCVTGTVGDYELVKKWYEVKGQHINWLGSYLSNIYTKKINSENTVNKEISILVGNSATLTNNHLKVFQMLKKYKHENIKIFSILSYGDTTYAQLVIKSGYDIFNDKFMPILEFMPYMQYLKFLEKIDIAIFHAERQQATGNIIQLLGMGKKVYINKISTLNGVFKEYGIKIFNSNKIDLTKLDKNTKESNKKLIEYYFSKDRLIDVLRPYFDKE